MSINTIDCSTFREMLLTGAALLEQNKQTIDSLNVFPVPDGDTGTNMSMTMQRAVAEIKQTNPSTVEEVASALSMGALKGARGNSGVILSQIFRGFSSSLKGSIQEITPKMFANALIAGTEFAYKAVMKPREGTMLTVSRMIGEAVKNAADADKDIEELLEVMLSSGEVALKNTPELLPVLKEAGVVDSGGMGLLTIYRGFKMAFDGEELDAGMTAIYSFESKSESTDLTSDDHTNITFGYCTEFFIIHCAADDSQVDAFRKKLEKIGDSIVAVKDGDIVKVHVHSNSPGKVIQLALQLGEIDSVKIENMREQNREIERKRKASEKEIGIVAVSVGDGIDEAFKSLGVDQLISGGQTMNPSIDTISQAIRLTNARNVFVFPNNSNIIMAAQQAAELAKCNVIVLPTKSIVQGITALMSYSAESNVVDNKAAMENAITGVLSGSVTYAVRDTSYDGKSISVNDIIGMVDNKIRTVGKNVADTTEQLIIDMMNEHGDDAIVTLYYGKDISEDEAYALASKMEAAYPDVEFIIQQGGQPLYYYYVSVE